MIKRLLSIIVLLIICDLKICFAQNFNFNEDNNQKKEFVKNNPQKKDPCLDTKFYHQVILNELNKGNFDVFTNLEKCFKNDRSLIMKAVAINPEIFIEVDEELHNDYYFVKRLAKINPEVIGYSSVELRSNPNFMEEMTFIYREALKYANWNLLDNKPFMSKMIDFDSLNYKYASDRIRLIPEIARKAFQDNGMMLKYAPYSIKNDQEMVMIAIDSDIDALELASKKIRNDSDFIKLKIDQQNNQIDLEKLQKFIERNYYQKSQIRNLDKNIVNQGKYYGKRQIFDHNYVIKWKKKLGEIDPIFKNYKDEYKIVTIESRNYKNNFKEDLKSFPKLVEKIIRFLKKHKVDDNTIDNLKVTFLWEITNKPRTLAFNLYFLRDSSDNDLDSNYANLTTLTVIATDGSKNSKINSKNNDQDLALENHDQLTLQLTQQQNEEDQENPIEVKTELDLDEDIQIDELNLDKQDDHKNNIKNKDKKNTKNNSSKKVKDSKKDQPKKNLKNKVKIIDNENSNWDLSVIEAIFDQETKIDPIYRNGHKKHLVWDLYKTNKEDLDPKIIFKVEDKMNEYFEVFARQKNNKYKLIYPIDK